MPTAPSAVSEAKSGKAWHSIADTRPHTNSKFKQMKGSELTLEWLQSDPRAFSEPIFIAKPDGLDMRVLPVDIKISEIAALVGVDKALDVIDVASQSGLSNWTLGKWAEYYESDPAARDKIRNVISLELSDSPIRDRIASPKLVREIDWVENYWPKELIEQNVYPQVSRYCLMSPGQSWTDWHCDFSASSVRHLKHACPRPAGP
jgi:F-box/leucine-rich repeat protein 10/11